MSGNVVALAGLLLTLLICGLAVAKGGPAERYGGMLVFVTCLAATSAQVVFGAKGPVYIILGFDGVLAIGFLILTIRFASLWLGVAMMLQSASFALHSETLSSRHPDVAHYVMLVNLLTLGVLLLLLFATLVAWMKRSRSRPKDPGLPGSAAPA